MGAVKDQEHQRREKKRATRRRELAPQGIVSIDMVDSEVLLGTLAQILNAGGAFRIGLTRDRGAFAFGIYGDGADPYTDYVRFGEDINTYLINLGQFFAGEDETPAA